MLPDSCLTYPLLFFFLVYECLFQGFYAVGDLNIHLKNIHNLQFPYGCFKCLMVCKLIKRIFPIYCSYICSYLQRFTFHTQLKKHILDKHEDNRHVGLLNGDRLYSKIPGAADEGCVSTFNEWTVFLKRYVFIEEPFKANADPSYSTRVTTVVMDTEHAR